MLERFIDQTSFTSQEDFIKHFKIKVPENFNFGYDVVDAWAAERPDKNALLWTNDKGEHIQFTYADLKKYTDMTASYFQSLGIGHGDKVMLILKRRYEFWFSIIALHKIGAVVIPATHLLTKKDIVYRCKAATIKMIVAAGEEVITKHILDAMPECPSVEKLVSVGPEYPEGFEDFHKGMESAAPFVRPEHPNTNDDIMLMYLLQELPENLRWWHTILSIRWDTLLPEVSGIIFMKTVCILLLPTPDGEKLYGANCMDR